MQKRKYRRNIEKLFSAPEPNVYSIDLHKRLKEIVKTRMELWYRCTEHAAAYREVMGKIDIGEAKTYSMFPTFEDMAEGSPIHVDTHGHTFGISTFDVAGSSYGTDWHDLIVALCASDSDVNTTSGIGTAFISAVDDVWHKRIMEKLEAGEYTFHTPKSRIQEKQNEAGTYLSSLIHVGKQVKPESIRSTAADIFRYKRHSENYNTCLNLNEYEQEELGELCGVGGLPGIAELAQKALFSVTLNSHTFAIIVKHNAPFEVSDCDWTDNIMAICTSDWLLNETSGYGTSLINTVPHEWHERLLEHIQSKTPSALH